MDSSHGSMHYYPPPPGQASHNGAPGPPPPLPPRQPIRSGFEPPPPVPPRPSSLLKLGSATSSGSASLLKVGVSLARNVAGNLKTLARESRQSSAGSEYPSQAEISQQQQPYHQQYYFPNEHTQGLANQYSYPPYPTSQIQTHQTYNPGQGQSFMTAQQPETTNAVSSSYVTPYHYPGTDEIGKPHISPLGGSQFQNFPATTAPQDQQAFHSYNHRVKSETAQVQIGSAPETQPPYSEEAVDPRNEYSHRYEPQQQHTGPVAIIKKQTYPTQSNISHQEQHCAVAPEVGEGEIPLPAVKPQENQRQSTATQAISDAISGLASLALSENSPAPQPRSQHNTTWIEDEWIRPPLFFHAKGNRDNVVWDCPGATRDSLYATSWYHLPAVPEFTICTRCYERYIARTSLSANFELTGPVKGKCRFNVPRITGVLLPRCEALGDINLLQQYFSYRMKVKDCTGQHGFNGKAGVKLFIIDRETNNVMINFVACEACYEDIVLGVPLYANEFISREPRYAGKAQPENEVWTCDFSFPYVSRSFKVLARNNAPFRDWVDKCTKKFSLPKCDGKAVEASSREWVRPRDKVDNMVICEACYYDQVCWTALEASFEYIPITKPSGSSERMDWILGYRNERPTEWVCDAKTTAVLCALEAAVKRQDAEIFSRAARKILGSPPCTAEGIANGTWYTLAGGCDGFNLCEACMAGEFESFGQAQFLEKANSSGSETALLCVNHPSHPRSLQFSKKLFEAGQEGDWTRYEDNVRKYINVDVCMRDEHVPNRHWYGWYDCLICPDCYETISTEPNKDVEAGGRRDVASQKTDRAKNLRDQMEVHNDLITESRMCCMYSPRMRQKYDEAIAKGDPSELIEFSRQRHAVYARTVPQIKMLRQMQDMQMMMAMSAGMAGIMYQGASSIQTISGNTDGYLHGNSNIGWHETENGATSAQMFNQMSSGMSAANGSGGWMQIFRLAAEWDQWQ